ncbi:MAG: hypothetical protein WBG86_09255, partial [Polyangiales bacterium]
MHVAMTFERWGRTAMLRGGAGLLCVFAACCSFARPAGAEPPASAKPPASAEPSASSDPNQPVSSSRSQEDLAKATQNPVADLISL